MKTGTCWVELNLLPRRGLHKHS